MPKNITLMGASYTDVPSVKLPQTGGGQAQFYDVSGVTAIASDVAKGKKIILADGTYADGTGEMGGGGYEVESLDNGDGTQTFSVTGEVSVGKSAEDILYEGFEVDKATYPYLFITPYVATSSASTKRYCLVFARTIVNSTSSMPPYPAVAYMSTSGTGIDIWWGYADYDGVVAASEYILAHQDELTKTTAYYPPSLSSAPKLASNFDPSEFGLSASWAYDLREGGGSSIDTTTPISSVMLNDTEIPLVGGDEPVYETPTISIVDRTITAEANGKSATEQIPSQFIVPSGNLDITENGSKNVANYQTVNVNVPTPTPSYDTPSIEVSSGGLITASANGKSNTKQLTTKSGTTITPSSSQQTAISSGTYATGNILVSAVPTETKSAVTPTKSSQTISATSGKYMTSVTVNAIPSQYIIPSGSETKTSNGTYDVTALAEIVVNVSGGGGSTKNVQCYQGYASVTSTSYTATAVSLTVAKTGTYKVSWMGWRNTNSGTSGSQLYIGNSAYGSANTTFTDTYGHSVTLNNVSLTQGQTITVRARARSTSYKMVVGNLCIEEV